MTNPPKVLGFLDLAGAWDPSLAFVMGGAAVVAFFAFRIALGRGKTLSGQPLDLPASRAIDGRLIGGSLLYGVGWGPIGLCPGPAIADIGFLDGRAALFVVTMAVGMAVFSRLCRPYFFFFLNLKKSTDESLRAGRRGGIVSVFSAGARKPNCTRDLIATPADLIVPATPADRRARSVADQYSLDPSDDDCARVPFDALVRFAVEDGDRAGETGRPARQGQPKPVVRPVCVDEPRAASKAIGDLLLIGRKHVGGEFAVRGQKAIAR